MGLSLRVGRYDVQRALGKGATGTVYLARDTFTGREVALKTIEPEVFRDPEFGAVYRSQFRNEASLAGKLRHPHIAAILDALVQEDSGYIAMEYVPGGDLSGHVTPDRLLPVADVLQICFKCCGALEYAFRERPISAGAGRSERPGWLALLHVARTDRGQRAHLPQRHVLPRHVAL